MKSNERQMNTFKQYSYINCIAECRSEMVNELCGCAPYNFVNNGTSKKITHLQQTSRHESKHKHSLIMNFLISVKKCKIDPHLKCIRANSFRFSGASIQLNNDSSENSRYLRAKCKCLPDCLFHAYPSEISTGTLIRDYSRNALSFFKDVNLTDQTLVHIFFNDLIATHYRKDMYQNWLGILAAFGGEVMNSFFPLFVSQQTKFFIHF
jgi:amiloride-sensitive sodium channel